MRRSAIFPLLMLFLLGVGVTGFGQQSCEFDISGTWRIDKPGVAESDVYRFADDGTMVVLSRSGSEANSKLIESGSATFELDDPKSPKSITIKLRKGTVMPGGYGKAPMAITTYDDSSFTCDMPEWGPTRWVKVDENRYFILLVARNGEFYDSAGSAFPILIKVAGLEPEINAVGTYSRQGKRAFGPVPPNVYESFMKEPSKNSEVMLRLEINSAQYERGLKILKGWERRVRDGLELYPVRSYLNNVLLVKSVAETLNQCSQQIKLYEMTYLHPEDWITERYSSGLVPFNYFKELRRLNESLHVGDEKFQQASLSPR